MSDIEYKAFNKLYRLKFLKLTRATLTQLQDNLQASYLKVVERITSSKDINYKKNQEMLLREIHDDLARLEILQKAALDAGLKSNAALGIDQIAEFLKSSGVVGVTSLFSGTVDTVVERTYKRLYSDGLNLNARWRNYTAKQIERIKTALVQGVGAGQNSFEIANAIRQTHVDLEFKRIYRLTYTELAQSYNDSKVYSAEAWNSNPISEFDMILKCELSPRHKGSDVCDNYAGREFTPGEAPSVPFHPYCICMLQYAKRERLK